MARAATPVTIQLDWLMSNGQIGDVVALQKGYFRDEGLDVTLVNKPSGLDVISSVFGGDADFGFATYPVLVQAQLKTKGKQNLRVVVICPFVEGWIARHPEYEDLRYEPASKVTD